MNGSRVKDVKWIMNDINRPDQSSKGSVQFPVYVSGLAIMSVGMTGRRMTGRHRRTGIASL